MQMPSAFRASPYELVRERRAVSPEMALRLGRLFGNSPAFWLNLQRAVDIASMVLWAVVIVGVGFARSVGSMPWEFRLADM